MPPTTAHSRIDIDSDSTTPLAERLGYNQEPQAFPSLSERLQPSISQSNPAPLGERILKMRDGYTTGYQNPLEYHRPEPIKGSADLVARAIAQVESGNKQVKGASGEFGAYQFMPATWEAISKSMEGRVLPQTPENERRVATKKINQLYERFKAQGLDDITAARNVALVWNTSLGGSEVPLIKKGTNAKGVKYDSEAYARKVTETFNQLLQSQPQGDEFSYNKQLKDKPSEALAMGIKNTILPTPESPEQAIEMGLIPVKGPISGKDIYIDPLGVVGSMKRVGKNIAKKGVDAAKNIVNDIKGVSVQSTDTSVPFEGRGILNEDIDGGIRVSDLKGAIPKRSVDNPRTTGLPASVSKYKNADEFYADIGAIKDNYDWSYLDEMKARKAADQPYSHSDFAYLSKIEATKRGKESRTFYRAGEIGKDGDIWLTPQEAGATQYGLSGGTKVGEYKVATKNPLVLQDVESIEKILGKKLDSESNFTNSPALKQAVIDYAKKNGHDSVLMPDSFPDGAGGMESLVVWDKNLVITKSQAAKLYKQSSSPSIPKELEPLAAEARKYESAEEFINAQKPVYHNTDADFSEFKPKNGAVWFTDNKNSVMIGVGKKKNQMERFIVGAKFATGKDKKLFQDELKAKGFNGRLHEDTSTTQADGNYFELFDTDKIMTREQLLDFYRKATGN